MNTFDEIKQRCDNAIPEDNLVVYLLEQISSRDRALSESCKHIDNIGIELRSIKKRMCKLASCPDYWRGRAQL